MLPLLQYETLAKFARAHTQVRWDASICAKCTIAGYQQQPHSHQFGDVDQLAHPQADGRHQHGLTAACARRYGRLCRCHRPTALPQNKKQNQAS